MFKTLVSHTKNDPGRLQFIVNYLKQNIKNKNCETTKFITLLVSSGKLYARQYFFLFFSPTFFFCTQISNPKISISFFKRQFNFGAVRKFFLVRVFFFFEPNPWVNKSFEFCFPSPPPPLKLSNSFARSTESHQPVSHFE